MFFALLVFRALAAIPIPGIDASKLAQLLTNSDFGQFLGLLNIFSGGGLSSLSIVMLGVGPYITASIIMQLFTVMVPKLKAMYQEEGELGRRKFTQWGRMLTIPLAVIQGASLLVLLEKQGIISPLSMFDRIENIIIVTAGTVLLLWIGELISEYGIGNGVSLIIFAGIVSVLPSQVSQFFFAFDKSQIPLLLAYLILAVVVIAAVVFITEAERPLPVTYAKRVRGSKVYGGVSTYLPLRLNQAGVIPIIFAISLLLLPQMVATFFITLTSGVFQTIGTKLMALLQNQLFYGAMYFFLVFLFTYFYTAVTFDPESISTNLQKNGAFIPGIRPGAPTAEHIGSVLTRITLFGALFLGLIAVLPLIVQSLTGFQSLAVGGTSLLIVVSVVLDLIKRIDAQIAMREY